ncbi:hypothetical protein JQN61_04535 [Pseudomonas putida]|nr:hypothetical protein JQN61_04535 [Pseudomonas putida]
MNKHTPGPWSYWSGYNPFDKLEAQVTAEGGDIVIASYNSLIEQGEANACLMAASPDLLSALEDLLLAYNDPGNTGSTHDDKVAAARAAIDRARGMP